MALEQNGDNGIMPDNPEISHDHSHGGAGAGGGHQHPIRETYFQSGEMTLHARYDTRQYDTKQEADRDRLRNDVNTWFSQLQVVLPVPYQNVCTLKDNLTAFEHKLTQDELGGSLLVGAVMDRLLELSDDELAVLVDVRLGHRGHDEDEHTEAHEHTEESEHTEEHEGDEQEPPAKRELPTKQEQPHPAYDDPNWLKAAREILRERDQQFEDILNAMNDKAGFNTSGLSITMQACAPNWLFSSMTHQSGHPSPGGWPVPVPAASLRPRQHEFKTRLIDRIIHTCPTIPTAPNVHVVIFDTAPADGAVTLATPTSNNPDATYTFTGPLRAACSLFQDLCQGRRSFEQRFTRIARANALGITLPTPPPPDGSEIPEPHYTNRDGYNVSDHGVFIAGIVHSLAPNADIHLVEVMNSHGMGTLESLIDGVNALVQGKEYEYLGVKYKLPKPEAGRTLVVNCSLGLDLPRPDEDNVIRLTMSYRPPGSPLYRSPDDLADTWTFTLRNANQVLQPVHATFAQLEAAFSDATNGGDGVIVASAGNDGLPGIDPPPPAYYPAAFPNVLAVGALEDATTRAWYSNLADDAPYVYQMATAQGAPRPYRGVVVSGGKMDYMHVPATANPAASTWSRTNVSEGMLGVYIGTFPTWNTTRTQVIQESSPSSGWARWAGTSFATAVMSGILARAASKRCIVRLEGHGTRHFYEMLEAWKLPVTRYGEIILSVPQGPPWWAEIWESIRNFLKRLGLIK